MSVLKILVRWCSRS